MGFWDILFRRKAKQQATPPSKQTVVKGSAASEQIAVEPNSIFQVGMFKDAAKAHYRHPNTRDMAIAARKIAELLNEHLPASTIRCMVPASAIDKKAPADALPVHFLIFDGDTPKVAVVIVTRNGFNSRTVIATRQVCEANGIAYIRVYANGSYADWIQDEGGTDPEVVEMCKSGIIAKIKEGLIRQDGKKRRAKPVPKQEKAKEIEIPTNSRFQLEVFQKAAKRSYYKPSMQAMANALGKVADLIAENFDTSTVRCMVPASVINHESNPRALPVHFLFYNKKQQPKVAVVIVTKNGYNVPNVRATKAICEGMGIRYLRIFATGSYADWMSTQPAKARMCQSHILKHIHDGLK